ncbi:MULTISPECIES: metal-dependent transcriptional regulator [Halorubrum]|uniref:Iron (Metal) dependent repressor, DtxR family n=1 Tax=Halorubrum sodomense TaxID=35743 RepID=A0A1I6FLR9_HALSD|nr:MULTISPECIES: metal-dependent transcriptional regulator [Halorubrum]TKX54579.1 metal-dependent transcriptional regulator [Halorubrum sp. SP3]SFR30892.1 iron (metal) dependent repressor, DtxR family [Halorubrum sodomense]
MPTDAVEDYLKAIYRIESRAGPPVSTSQIAEALEKTPATVTSMVETLSERGLLSREKYTGVELTPAGEVAALEVVRRHRLIEAFLADQLDYEPTEVHDEADALEHHVSEEFTRRVERVLDYPAADPHGDPIPPADLSTPEDAGTALVAALDPGERGTVVRVSDRDPDVLEFLVDAGITPGRTVEVVDVTSFGLVTVRTSDGSEHGLPEAVADRVSVRRAAESTAATDGQEAGDA